MSTFTINTRNELFFVIFTTKNNKVYPMMDSTGELETFETAHKAYLQAIKRKANDVSFEIFKRGEGQ